MDNNYQLTTKELEGVAAIRETLEGNIPADLDTDFNLRRWLRAKKGDIPSITARFRTQINNRKAVGIEDAEHFFHDFEEKSYCSDIAAYLAMSRLRPFNGTENSILYIEGAITDPHKLVKTIQTGEYVRLMHICCEYFLHTILKHERTSGKPSQGICIYDMSGAKLRHFLNPMSDINRLFLARIMLWQDYYAELLEKVYIVNPPGALSTLWRIITCMIDKQYHSKFVFINNHSDLQEYLPVEMIPKVYGGELGDTSGHSDGDGGSCLNKRKTFTEQDYYKSGQAWTPTGYSHSTLGPTTSCSIARKKTHSVTIKASAGQHLLWYWTSNSILEFSVACGVGDDTQLVHPQLKLSTHALPEQQYLTCPHTGLYTLHWANTNALFYAQLQYAVKLIPEL